MTDAPGTLDRRALLRCMRWAGTAAIWTVAGGVPRSRLAGSAWAADEPGFSFAQVSDSHLGFDRAANHDTIGTFRQALAAIAAPADKPAFVIHTGDITHLSTPEQFDAARQLLGATGLKVFTVPGEHDVLEDTYLDHYGEGTQGDGWYSFDAHGVHFIGLVNVMDVQGSLGRLGDTQLDWLKGDVAGLTASTPIVVFAHMPLWTAYETWGWGTEDSARALTYLQRFGSVTVLNGHVHQIMQKIEGHVAFHTARSTAFPQAAPGTAAGPGPLKLPPNELKRQLGVTRVSLVSNDSPLAIVDTPLLG